MVNNLSPEDPAWKEKIETVAGKHAPTGKERDMGLLRDLISPEFDVTYILIYTVEYEFWGERGAERQGTGVV